jgi:hypothetical protein
MLLPLELYGLIASFCDDDTLAQLVRTSRDVSQLALGVLYKTAPTHGRLPLSRHEKQTIRELRREIRSDDEEIVPCCGDMKLDEPLQLYTKLEDGTFKYVSAR